MCDKNVIPSFKYTLHSSLEVKPTTYQVHWMKLLKVVKKTANKFIL
jgi:hypothetical protein